MVIDDFCNRLHYSKFGNTPKRRTNAMVHGLNSHQMPFMHHTSDTSPLFSTHPKDCPTTCACLALIHAYTRHNQHMAPSPYCAPCPEILTVHRAQLSAGTRKGETGLNKGIVRLQSGVILNKSIQVHYNTPGQIRKKASHVRHAG